ncbi:MAG: sugar phosphate isomerase/epimerase family protein [Acidobacteriota bacterium]
MGPRRFGVSTHLYHGQRLSRDHLLAIAQHGFEAVELFATRTHFDYHNPTAVGDLQQWLADAGLELHGVHAPVTDSYVGGRWGPPLTLASAEPEARAAALVEAQQALFIARRIPIQVLVVHLGLPRTQSPSPGDNNRDSARRSVEELQRLASPLGVRVAVEVIPNELSRAGSLVHFVEEDLDAPEVGICLDFGHAHMDGDLLDAIETVSGHVITTHVHDNHGRTDDHLVPFDGTIDWPAAMTAVQKIGYDQTLLFEIAAHRSPVDTLVRAQRAREKLERLLAD